MTQRDMVLSHLQEHGTITSIDAMRMYGIIQLPRRIFDLRKEGYPIESRFLSVKNRYEQPVTIAQYKLRGSK